MKLKLPAYTHEVSKGARAYYYYRRGKFRVKLPGRPFSTEFMDAHTAAEAAYAAGKAAPSSIGVERLKPGSFNALIMAYYCSPEFLNLKPISKQTNRNVMEKIRQRLGDAQVASFLPRHFEAMMAEKADKPDAANRIRHMMKLLMRNAVRLGYRTDDPTSQIRKLKNRSDGYKTWGEEEIERFCATYGEGTRARLAFDILLYTGLRRAAVVKLGRQHLRDRILTVRMSKTGQTVSIPVHPVLRRSLDSLPSDQLTFLMTDQGKPFTANGFGNWIGDLVRQAGLREGMEKGEKGFSAHGLRKAICRRLADAGCDALQIMAITGHSDIKQVMVYIAERDQRRAADSAIKSLSAYGSSD